METELFVARINDIADICEKTCRPKYIGFLSPEQGVLATQILSKRAVRFELSGGYPDASRVILGCFPDWMDETVFPITAVSFNYRKTDTLHHRDFLGSLMALGIKRETVGDILIEEGRAVAFLADEITDYVLSQVEKIGRVGVTLETGFKEPLPQQSELREFTETVASLRLDCVVAAVGGFSRAAANEKIANGFVAVNSVTVEKSTRFVSGGDILTVRGSGKYIIDSVCDRTKKDRIILKYKKYV